MKTFSKRCYSFISIMCYFYILQPRGFQSKKTDYTVEQTAKRIAGEIESKVGYEKSISSAATSVSIDMTLSLFVSVSFAFKIVKILNIFFLSSLFQIKDRV